MSPETTQPPGRTLVLTDTQTKSARPGSFLRRSGGTLTLIGASAIWGLWTTAEKYSLRGLPVMTVLAVSLGTATALLWLVLLRRGHRRPPRDQLRRLALLGLFEPMLGYGAIGLGLSRIQATEASILDGTEACFVVALVALVSRRPPTLRGVGGVLLGLVGVAALGGSSALLGLRAGDLLVLLGAFAAATATLITDRVVRDTDPLVATAYQFTFGLLFTVPLLVGQWIVDGRLTTPQAGPQHWLVAAAVCGAGLASAFLMYNYAVTRTPVTTAGVLLNSIPVFGIVSAVVFLGERIGAWQYVGAALVLAGIFLFSEADTDG
ncbi:DMT family transporter [Kitasatospora sp. NBC_01250]|uniref:DMT family transporter n=1 Tax=unclassified Kitasatospora TaxID=2633591 RepID=UPI002E0F74BF|nr:MULTISPECIES: DMT family transporter [unclassified Kitasatospora]WSJ70271.1 DMT family transporter [Kitasatospora sp. NBC_01302]